MNLKSILTGATLISASFISIGANAVTNAVNMTFQSGATFSGLVTFANDYSYVTGVNGTLTGYQPNTPGYVGSGSDSINWVWANGQNFSTGIGNYSTFLMDGAGSGYSGGSYTNFIQFAYNYLAVPVLSFSSGASIYATDNFIDYSDPMVSGTIGSSQSLIKTLLGGSVMPYVDSQWPVFRDQYQLTNASAGFYSQSMMDYVGANFLSTGIGAKFTPNLGLTVDAAAAALGYDHFNWIQLYGPTDTNTGRIADWTQAQLDPSLGCYQAFADLTGNPCPNRDLLPWYNDEQFANDGTRIYDDNGNRVNSGKTRLEQWTVAPDTLLFSDSPTVNESFQTCLAGVRADGSGDIFFSSGVSQNDLCFDWKSSYDGKDIGLTQDIGGFGGANITFLGFSPEPSADELQALAQVDVGAMNLSSVPEPATYTMLLAGLGLMGFARRRKPSSVIRGCINLERGLGPCCPFLVGDV